ncbi:hypothetical protein [uncultured Umboniibacter sp.]|uniref:hypothetical protein n=1 Tax=uncultured Umboniibacter sp. TaxID=1798917 RepID=UPI00262E40F2|nr:hypothetical protein [uncultured Umboniibacter sp.]
MSLELISLQRSLACDGERVRIIHDLAMRVVSDEYLQESLSTLDMLVKAWQYGRAPGRKHDTLRVGFHFKNGRVCEFVCDYIYLPGSVVRLCRELYDRSLMVPRSGVSSDFVLKVHKKDGLKLVPFKRFDQRGDEAVNKHLAQGETVVSLHN